jgi:hypothetical protein
MATAIDNSYGLVTAQARSNQEKLAGALAERLAADEAVTKALRFAIIANKDNKTSVNRVHFAIMAMMEANPTEDGENEMDAWPVPGSKKKDVGDNEPFDKFEYKDQSSSTGALKKDSFYAILTRDLPMGAAILKRKEAVDNDANLSDGDKDRKKADINDEMTTLQGKVRLAVAAYFHIKAMRKRFGKIVNVEYAMRDADPKTGESPGVDYETPRCILIENKAKKGVAKYFSIPNFLRLDLDLAAAKGGTYADIVGANKRNNDDEQPDEDKHIKIATNRDFEDATIATLNYLNFKLKDTVNQKDLFAFFRGAGSDARLRTFFDLHEKMTVITEMPEFRKRYEADVVQTDDKAAA